MSYLINQPILLIVVPLLLAFVSVMLKKFSKYLLAIGILFNISYMFTVRTGNYIIGGFEPPFSINLNIDNYALYTVIVINLIFALTVFIGAKRVGKYATVLLVALGSLNGLLMTGDLFNLFVFLEIASIAAYIIVSSNKKYVHVFNYLVLGTVGSSLYLFGIIILYSTYGTLNMEHIHTLIMENDVTISLPIILIFAGLAVETKLLPFNSWVKGVLQNSNRLVGPMIASVYSGVMLIVFGRLFGDVLVLDERMKFILAIVAVVTLLAGEFTAFQGKSLREILLYSSIAQSGLAVMLFIYNLTTVALLVILGHVIVKFILFGISGIIAEDAGTDKIEDLRGLFKKKWVFGLAFTISAMSLLGLPLFFGFFVKFNVLVNLFEANHYLMPAIILVASLIEGGYMIRMLIKLWNSGEEGSKPTEDTLTDVSVKPSFAVSLIIFIVSISLLVMGFLPDFATDKCEEAADALSGSIPSYIITLEGGTK